LGSVLGQIRPGIELRLTQGGPGFAKVESFLSDQKIVILLIAPLKTSKVLTSAKQVSQLTKIGIKSVGESENIKEDFAVEFIHIGRRFMKNCGLSTKRIEELQKDLLMIGEDLSTMAMIGETLIILPKDQDKLNNFINTNDLQVIYTKITSKKPYLIKN
jgi:pantoate kinase